MISISAAVKNNTGDTLGLGFFGQKLDPKDSSGRLFRFRSGAAVAFLTSVLVCAETIVFAVCVIDELGKHAYQAPMHR